LSSIEQISQPSADDIAQLQRGLTSFNRSRIPDKGYVPIFFRSIDEDGQFVGGISGHVSYGWLFVDLLWVDERCRATGQGRALMLAAEAVARKHGCKNAWLDTFSFQARGFYERLGYIVFAELEEFPPGHSRYLMRKRLVPE
jgi:GNAT superfamily N-acetyltransferase